MKLLLGFVLAFAIGAACRFFQIPVPAPPKLVGALLVLTATLGYVVTDSVLTRNGSPPLNSSITEQHVSGSPPR